MNKLLLTLSVMAFSGSLLAQVSPSTPKAARVRISLGPGIELSREHLTIIRWTVNNPGGQVQGATTNNGGTINNNNNGSFAAVTNTSGTISASGETLQVSGSTVSGWAASGAKRSHSRANAGGLRIPQGPASGGLTGC